MRKLLADLRVKLKNPDLDAQIVTISEFYDIEEAYIYLKTDNKEKFDCVIMDSLTEIQQVCMDAILKDEKIDKARIQDWGTLNNRMVKMIRAFRDLDMHYIVTALADVDKDDESNAYKPLVQGKLKETLAGYFDEVFYLHAVDVKTEDGKVATRRWLQTSGSAKYQAKDRSGMLPRECPADFAWVLRTISGAPSKQPAQGGPAQEPAAQPQAEQQSKETA